MTDDSQPDFSALWVDVAPLIREMVTAVARSDVTGSIDEFNLPARDLLALIEGAPHGYDTRGAMFATMYAFAAAASSIAAGAASGLSEFMEESYDARRVLEEAWAQLATFVWDPVMGFRREGIATD